MWQCRLEQLVGKTENLLPNQQRRGTEDEDDEEEEEEEEAEDHLILGMLLSPLAPSREQLSSMRPQRSEERPSYSMEHFRWGKPMSRKRRPVKVHTAVSTDDEGGHEEPSMEAPFLSLSRRQVENGKEHEHKKNANTKSTTKYRITHFRWSAPPASKRYGGFMKPWSERSHKPLLTLLRNIIAINRQ